MISDEPEQTGRRQRGRVRVVREIVPRTRNRRFDQLLAARTDAPSSAVLGEELGVNHIEHRDDA
jgi:hypothetical protein